MTEASLIAKINRRIEPLGHKLKTKRSDLMDGPHYIIDGNNIIVRRKIQDLLVLWDEVRSNDYILSITLERKGFMVKTEAENVA
jgi:hypothetical protein